MTTLDEEPQKEQQAFMLHDGDGIAQWLVVVDATYLWCDFAIYEATGWEVDNESPLFELKNRRSSVECASWSNACDPTMTGYVKWDGCTEFTASAHFCDAADSYETLHTVIQETMNRAHQLMTKLGNDESPDWTAPETGWRFRVEPYALPEPWVNA